MKDIVLNFEGGMHDFTDPNKIRGDNIQCTSGRFYVLVFTWAIVPEIRCAIITKIIKYRIKYRMVREIGVC